MSIKIESIKVFSYDFKLLGIVEAFESFFYTQNVRSVGEFQLITTVSATNLELLAEDNLIMIDSRLDKIGIIKHVQISRKDGAQVFKIEGHTLDHLLDTRISYISDTEAERVIKGKPQDLIRDILRDNVIAPKDPDRKIEHIYFEADPSITEEIVYRLKTQNTILETIEEICSLANLKYHFEIDFNRPGYVLKVNKICLLSDKIIFKSDFNNIKGAEYLRNSSKMKNTTYIHTAGDSIFCHNGDSKGLERKELFSTHRELAELEDYKSVAEYYLSKQQAVETLSAEIMSTDLFEYGEDFNIGDVVSIQLPEWNVSKDLLISSITEVYDDNPRLVAEFGEPVPSLTRKIKDYITNYYG